MKNPYLICISLLLLLFFGSCHKKSSRKNKLADCSREQHFDSTKLAENLIGSWRWTELVTEVSTRLADKNVFVIFEKNGTFSFIEGTDQIVQGKWSLKISDSNFFELVVDRSSEFLSGNILLCGDRVVFHNSYRDGGDNYFTREN
jgi:hypothetical protein